MDLKSTHSKVTIPALALTGAGNTTRAFLTEREALALVTADNYTQQDIAEMLTADCSYQLSTGAKIARVPDWMMGSKHRPSTRARSWQVYGYHYAGTDVTSLVNVAA
jgi:hypothetical protein